MCRWADAHEVSDEALTEAFQIMAMKGGAKIEDLTLSESTVNRLRLDERGHAHLSVQLDEYDRFVTVHFDGKRVKMGPNQGGGLLEHIAVLVSGISGVKQLNIEIAANSTGVWNQVNEYNNPVLHIANFHFQMTVSLGQETFRIVWNNIEDCRLKNSVICLSFDTTASNTGIFQGKHTSIKKKENVCKSLI